MAILLGKKHTEEITIACRKFADAGANMFDTTGAYINALECSDPLDTELRTTYGRQEASHNECVEALKVGVAGVDGLEEILNAVNNMQLDGNVNVADGSAVKSTSRKMSSV